MTTESKPPIHAIHAGDTFSRRVLGGNVRTTAPCDGLIVPTVEEDIFLPLLDITKALGELGIGLHLDFTQTDEPR